MTKKEFLEAATEAARASAEKSGLPAGVTVAQAALESNFGESQLSRAANNYFGIKAHWKHPAMEFRTREFEGGVEKEIVARFSVYASMQECFECRDRLILNGAVYAAARAAKDDAELFVGELAKHWATDPGYAEKVMHLYKACGLEQLDERMRNAE